MTLDELNEIQREANTLKRDAAVLDNAELSLASVRRAKDSFTVAYSSLVNNEHRNTHGRHCLGAFLEVLDEHMTDLLRVTELRLQARARIMRQREKLLLDQVDGFLNGGKS